MFIFANSGFLSFLVSIKRIGASHYLSSWFKYNVMSCTCLKISFCRVFAENSLRVRLWWTFLLVCIIPSALFRTVEGCYREIDREFDFNFLQPLACFLADIKCQYQILSASAGGGGGGNVCFAKSIKSPSVTALLGTSFQARNFFRLPNLSQRCITDLQS